MGDFRREFGDAWRVALEGPTRLLLWLSLASLIAYGVLMPTEPQTKHIILKGMGVGFLALSALISARRLDGFLLAIALAFGAAGDVLIARPGGFINGLGAFLIGHLFYIALFLKNRQPWGEVSLNAKVVILLLIAAAAGMTALLEPYVGALGVPVKIYTLVLTTMAVCAVMSRFSMLVGVGGIAFFLSDGLIAVGRFMGPALGDNPFWQDLPYFIWGLYAVAQVLIFLGVRKSA